MSDVELIRFVMPSSGSVLYVRSIAKEVLEDDIHALFSQFGLIHDIKFRYKSESESHKYIAFCLVTFYSRICAKEAVQNLHNIEYKGRLIGVKFAGSEKTYDRDYPLGINKCVELVNYYFGFGGWSSSVVELKKIETGFPEFDEESKEYTTGYRCIIKIYFSGGSSAYGVGEGIESGPERHQTATMAIKTATTLARKDAFQHITIIATSSGKVGVHIQDNENVIMSDESLNSTDFDCTKVLR